MNTCTAVVTDGCLDRQSLGRLLRDETRSLSSQQMFFHPHLIGCGSFPWVCELIDFLYVLQTTVILVNEKRKSYTVNHSCATIFPTSTQPLLSSFLKSLNLNLETTPNTMPPAKGGNAKKEAGRAKKAENEVCGCGFSILVLHSVASRPPYLFLMRLLFQLTDQNCLNHCRMSKRRTRRRTRKLKRLMSGKMEVRSPLL